MGVNWTGTSGPDVKAGTTLDDILYGAGGADTLKGLAGADLLDGGLGNDTLEGGTGNDIYIVDSILDVIIEVEGGGTDDQVKATASFDLLDDLHIEKISAADVEGTKPINLYGNRLHQEITGNAGKNLLSDGGKGAGDTLKGLGGSDTYRVYNSSTVIVEGQNEGTLDSVLTAVTFDLLEGVHVEALAAYNPLSTAPIKLYGNTLAQEITGNAGDNFISDGGKGAGDTLKGLGGNDTYRVYNSDDVIIEGANEGSRDAVLTNVDYSLSSGVHVEKLSALDTSSTAKLRLHGNALSQEIIGNAGANVLGSVEGEADTLRGLGGNDTYYVSNEDDAVIEGVSEGSKDIVMASCNYTLASGVHVESLGAAEIGLHLSGNEFAQILSGSSGADVLKGNGGNDTIHGEEGGDTIFGGDGNDFVYAGSGNDTISGGAGNDGLMGSVGADDYLFDTALNGITNVDRIYNFSSIDEILLSKSIFGGAGAIGTLAATAFRANKSGEATHGADRIIYEQDTGELYYDADGSGSGLGVLFAILDKNLSVTAADFIVIA